MNKKLYLCLFLFLFIVPISFAVMSADLSAGGTSIDTSNLVPYTGANQTIDVNQQNITSIKKTTYINSSYGVWSNSTDFIIGFIEGLS